MSRSIIHCMGISLVLYPVLFDFGVHCMCLLFDLRSLHNFSIWIKMREYLSMNTFYIYELTICKMCDERNAFIWILMA